MCAAQVKLFLVGDFSWLKKETDGRVGVLVDRKVGHVRSLCLCGGSVDLCQTRVNISYVRQQTTSLSCI